MVRIYLVLALVAVALLAGNLVLGFVMGDVAGSWQDYSATRQEFHDLRRKLEASGQATKGALERKVEAAARELRKLEKTAVPVFERLHLHRLLGVLAALVTVLVNSISITYFIGTGRWCKEVVHTYSLDTSLLAASAQLKRKSFPWALCSILLIIVLVALGAACDPSANPHGNHRWVLPHQWCAIVATAVIAWSFLVQVGNIGANLEVINKILDGVWKARGERAEMEKRETE